MLCTVITMITGFVEENDSLQAARHDCLKVHVYAYEKHTLLPVASPLMGLSFCPHRPARRMEFLLSVWTHSNDSSRLNDSGRIGKTSW